MGNNSERSQSNKKLSLLNLEEKDYDGLLKIGILVSCIAIVVLLIVFVWNQPFSAGEDYVVNHELLGTYGDFFGGVIGTFFAILTAILMFSTLKSQRELTKDSNKVQTNISELQRFNSLFFELLSLFRSQRDELNNLISENGTPKNYFDTKMKELYDSFEPSTSYGKTAKKAVREYLNFYLEHASELAPIFRSLYRLMDLIDNSEIDKDKKGNTRKLFVHN